MPRARTKPRTAFVLGGGGHNGAAEVGMLGPLFEHGVAPEVVVGTSVGALNGEHFVDGGIVNSVPISRAVELGAKEIYVLQVGWIESALTPPKTPVQVALVAFEIARRHRFARDLATLPKGVTAHVLPTGEP